MAKIIDIHTHRTTDATTIRAVGVHPWNAACESLPSEAEFARAEAIGEIGLDKACGVDWEIQTRVFERQLQQAVKFHKPVVLHVVRAFEEVMCRLQSYQLRAVIFHGFIGSNEQAKQALEKGYYLSFGARTKSSPKTIKALYNTPLDRLFVESDEEPTPIGQIYAEIARLRGVSIEELQEATRRNYERIFRQQ